MPVDTLFSFRSGFPMANHQVGRRAEAHGDERMIVPRPDAQQRDVVLVVEAHEGGGIALLVGEADPDALAAELDHVRVGEDVPLGVDDEARAQAAPVGALRTVDPVPRRGQFHLLHHLLVDVHDGRPDVSYDAHDGSHPRVVVLESGLGSQGDRPEQTGGQGATEQGTRHLDSLRATARVAGCAEYRG
jgi:hypothetical protein